ncbi:MAG TPA: phospholipase [Thermoanaerobaculia bacterium]|nr:phospholipase [Thermoanaerobaculia bacterium]
MTTETLLIETPVHGRVRVRPGGGSDLLVGFHGYAENADVNLQQLLSIPLADRWTLAAVQALHPFYNRQREVVASWMTRLDREVAIRDNLSYVGKVLDRFSPTRRRVFLGFSQGVAMAYRAASHHGGQGLIVLAGDVPPDVRDSPRGLPPVFLARGRTDAGYPEEQFKKDLRFLEGVTRVESLEFTGGHEWTDEFRSAVAAFLDTV